MMSSMASGMATTVDPQILWIHCNKCIRMYAFKERRYFLLACNHITCEKCSPPRPSETPNAMPIFKCPIEKCGKLTRAHEIGNSMPAHIKELFHPRPYLKNLPYERIWTFQQMHRQSFLRSVERIDALNKRLIQKIDHQRQKCKEYYIKLERLRNQRKALERRIRERMRIRKQQQLQQQQQRSVSETSSSIVHTQRPSTSGVVSSKRHAKSSSSSTSHVEGFKPPHHTSFLL